MSISEDSKLLLQKTCALLRRLPPDSDEFKIARYAVLAALKLEHLIEADLQRSARPVLESRRIAQALEISHGSGFVLTQHGITRTITSMFNEEGQRQVAAMISNFCARMAEIGFPTFITSGTLLGAVREHAFITHDDDIDLCYVSHERLYANILLERRELFHTLKSWADVITNLRDATGGHFHVTIRTGPVQFQFDLFTGWVDNGKFNEYPLRPNIIREDEILPLGTLSFYGADVPVPRVPEALLVVNYGESWQIPDPSYRFNWNENAAYYRFLTASRNEQSPSYPELDIVAVIPSFGAEDAPKAQGFDEYKIQSLRSALEAFYERPNLAVIGHISIPLFTFIVSIKEKFGSISFIDDLEPFEKDFHLYRAGQTYVAPEVRDIAENCATFILERERLAALDKFRKLLEESRLDVVFFDTNTYNKTLAYLNLVLTTQQKTFVAIFDEYLLSTGHDILNDEHRALMNAADITQRRFRYIGRSAWSQVSVEVRDAGK